MFYVTKLVNSFVREEEGQDLLEYALLVALIALVAIGGVTLAGQQVALIFSTIAGAILRKTFLTWERSVGDWGLRSRSGPNRLNGG